MDGTTVMGKLSIKDLEVETSFGKLTIPITSILSVRPGLDSLPDLGKKINDLDAYFVNDRMFACLSGEGIGLRLPVATATELQFARDDISAFTPGGMTSTREWVLLSRKTVADYAQDLDLFKITSSVDEAVDEIRTFYKRFHSIRYVGRQLAMRLTSKISAGQVAALHDQFSDLLLEGTFELRDALPEELDEPELKDFPRLIFASNRKSAARLRQLIDHLNRL